MLTNYYMQYSSYTCSVDNIVLEKNKSYGVVHRSDLAGYDEVL